MKKTIYTCDRCGKEITEDINGHPRYLNTFNLRFYFWHGGSMGGEEDISHIECELCEDCTRNFYHNIKNWLEKGD